MELTPMERFAQRAAEAVEQRKTKIYEAGWEAGFRAGFRTQRGFGMMVGGAAVALGFFLYVWLAQ